LEEKVLKHFVSLLPNALIFNTKIPFTGPISCEGKNEKGCGTRAEGCVMMDEMATVWVQRGGRMLASRTKSSGFRSRLLNGLSSFH
jgi:hypothetical protein